MSDRSCGTCTLCCRVLSVEADDGSELTALDSWCTHCKVGSGCAIYDARPKTCRAFRCGWLEGRFTDEDRPDRSKIIAMIGPQRLLHKNEWVTVPAMIFKECAPGAFETPRAKRMIASVAPRSRLPVALAPFERGLPAQVEARGEEQHRVFDPAWREAFEQALREAQES